MDYIGLCISLDLSPYRSMHGIPILHIGLYRSMHRVPALYIGLYSIASKIRWDRPNYGTYGTPLTADRVTADR